MGRWTRWAVGLATWLGVLLLAATALGKPIPNCKTPRGAADSVFLWQLGEPQSLSMAARCFERGGRSGEQLKETAKHLKAVFDARGAYVDMESISDDPGWLDPKTKQPRVVAHEDLPKVVIEKRGERWVWTKDALDWIDEEYKASLSGVDQVVEKLPERFRASLFGLAVWQYLALVLLVLLGLLVRRVLRAVVEPRVKRLTKRLNRAWPAKLVDVIGSPGAAFATAIILRIGYPQLRLPITVSSAMAVTIRVMIITSAIWALYRSIDMFCAWLRDRAERTDSKLDDQLVPLLRKTLKVLVVVLGTMVVLDNLSFDVTTLLTSFSIGTLAFGLAAKDALANLFGSISIFLDNPFQIGDWINLMGVDGTVEEVGFRSTRIRTFYNSVVVIPNARVADTTIDNYGQRQYRRCNVKLGLTYDTSPEQMQAFVEGCRAIIAANPMTRKDTYEVHMVGFGDSALEVMLYFFFECDTWTDELRERHNVYLEVMRLAADLGVSFAFPTQSLHIESAAAPRALEPQAPASAEQLQAVVDGYGPGGDRARPEGPEITASKYLPGQPAARGSQEG